MVSGAVTSRIRIIVRVRVGALVRVRARVSALCHAECRLTVGFLLRLHRKRCAA